MGGLSHELSQWDSARHVAAQVRSGQRPALDVAEEHIARVRARNPALNALIAFEPERVRADAQGVDQRLALGHDLPLAGVPITVKDNLWVRGYRQQQGSQVYEGFVAPRDCWAVQRLRELGAVVLGISNCSEFACKGITVNPVHGATRHPLDPTLTPGGSSGGAAAALAAGLGLLALGTDAGGSIRRPAAHTGLVGVKPSAGIVPHPWGFPEPNYGFSVVGLLATNVADAAWCLHHLAAWDAGDPSAPPLPVDLGLSGLADARTPPPTGAADRPWRIAWSPRLGCGFAVDTDVMACLQGVVERLRAAGHRVIDRDPPWPEGTGAYPLVGLQQAGLHALYGQLAPPQRARIDPDLQAQIALGAQVTPHEVARLLRLRVTLEQALHALWQDVDLLLCPTAPVVAWPLHQAAPDVIEGRAADGRAHAAFTPLFNYTGVPAVSVPAGSVRGLPVGLQVVAPRLEDARALWLARHIQALSQPR